MPRASASLFFSLPVFRGRKRRQGPGDASQAAAGGPGPSADPHAAFREENRSKSLADLRALGRDLQDAILTYLTGAGAREGQCCAPGAEEGEEGGENACAPGGGGEEGRGSGPGVPARPAAALPPDLLQQRLQMVRAWINQRSAEEAMARYEGMGGHS